MRRHHERLMAYAGGVALVVAGAALAKYVEPGAGAILVAAGGFLLGGIQKEMLPRPHRRSTDPAAGREYADGHKTPRVELKTPPEAKR